MNKTKKTLVIMAAGMGTRYGGVKQIDGFGPHGETIMDYSLFDALRSGFTKFIFIVRDEIRAAVEEKFFSRLQDNNATVSCAVQSTDRFVPSGYAIDRKKPWGTAHAMLCAKGFINGPFALINADDFYGRDSFVSLASFFDRSKEGHHAMVGYTLKDVLSPYGSVSRGVARQTQQGVLQAVDEVHGIVEEQGVIVAKSPDGNKKINPDLNVSMNSWGFSPNIFDVIEEMFVDFVKKHPHDQKAEFYIGAVVNALIEKKLGVVHVIPGGNLWFGATYKEDKKTVSDKIGMLIRQGAYPLHVWE